MDFGKLIAHRGVHNNIIPENSMAAFSLAIKRGLAIELDVRLTADKKLVVFHDKDLTRMCGVEGNISHFTYVQLCCFTLGNTKERIPLLSDVLKLVSGKVFLLIEIKEDCPLIDTEKRLSHLMKDYDGEWAVQSFNPLSILWFRLFDSNVCRGVLTSKFKPFKSLKHMLRYLCSFPVVWNTIAKPDFISCDLRSITFKNIEESFKYGTQLFSWTAKGKELIEEALKFSDSVIFDISDLKDVC